MSIYLLNFRYASIIPTLIPHTAVKDTTLGGYDIPAKTIILPNVWHLHHNQELWKDPFKFDPERFLDEEGILVDADHPNRKNLLPFGAGRRVCPGEVLARNRMFLIVTSLLQNYKFKEIPGKQPVDDPREYEFGEPMRPKAYKLRAEKRNR